jgi:hypothetical protein
MATIFYLILVFSGEVHFHFGWFIVSLFFDGGTRVITRYRYTSDPRLDGSDAK